MMDKKLKRQRRRTLRVRSKLKKSGKGVRLQVHKSNKYISAQLIDDKRVLAGGREKKDKPDVLGKKIAEMIKKENIEKVFFDRGRFKYHGIIAKFADAVRSCGIQI